MWGKRRRLQNKRIIRDIEEVILTGETPERDDITKEYFEDLRER